MPVRRKVSIKDPADRGNKARRKVSIRDPGDRSSRVHRKVSIRDRVGRVKDRRKACNADHADRGRKVAKPARRNVDRVHRKASTRDRVGNVRARRKVFNADPADRIEVPIPGHGHR